MRPRWPRPTRPADPAPDPLAGTQWRLTRIPGRNLGQVPVQNHPRLSFDGTRARGRGVCNPLTATYTLTPPDGLVFGRVGGAMMPCREGQQLEAFFIDQLEGVQRYSIEGDTLRDGHAHGTAPAVRAHPHPSPERQLAGQHPEVRVIRARRGCRGSDASRARPGVDAVEAPQQRRPREAAAEVARDLLGLRRARLR